MPSYQTFKKLLTLPPGLWVPAHGLVSADSQQHLHSSPPEGAPRGCRGLAQLVPTGTLSALDSGNEWKEFNSVLTSPSACEMSSRDVNEHAHNYRQF